MIFVMRPHDHPFWGKCQECSAAPEYQQILAHLAVISIFVGSLLGLLFLVLHGMVHP